MFQYHGHDQLDVLSRNPRALVIRARRQSDGRAVILKTTEDECPEPAVFARFQREFEILRLLDGRGAARVLEFNRVGFRPVLVIEDIGGTSVDLLYPAGFPTVEAALDLAIGTLDCLADIHRAEIIHKDVNPSNLILGENGRLVFIDFGISTRVSREQPSFAGPGGIEGTLRYVSPEQTGRLNRRIDRRTDFYSFGAMLFEWLTGRPPFDVEDPLDLVYAHLALAPPDARELNPAVPPMVAAILARLLAKNADERYQSAEGIRADLVEARHRLRARDATGFSIGRHDATAQVGVPRRLHGRENEKNALFAAFERASRGAREIVTVAGYSGIGKTALVQELFPPVTRQHGFFAAGKFEQFQRNVPYSALSQAFRGLVRTLLTENENELAQWRARIGAALGDNLGVAATVVPELALIVGTPPPVTDLHSVEAGRRLQHVFRRFTACFAAPEHPLVVFLDDLQWADAGSLALISDLLADESTGHTLFVFAYRENETPTGHQFQVAVEGIRQRGIPVTTLSLAPLDRGATRAFVADVLGEDQSVFAEILHVKTDGNPFFVSELLKKLHADGHLAPAPAGGWTIDLDAVRATNPSDNVVDLLTESLRRLPDVTRETLTVAAAIGQRFDTAMTGRLLDRPEAVVRSALAEAATGNFVVGQAGETVFSFVHDRVQQAAYALIPEAERPGLHRRIGRLLLDRSGTPDFETLDHLNLGATADREENEQLARFNLTVGITARQAAAFAPALNYFRTGLERLAKASDRPWTTHYELALGLHVEAVEAAYSCGEAETLERLTATTFANARTVMDAIRVWETKLRNEFVQYRFQEAVATGLHALEQLGLPLPAAPGPETVLEAFTATRATLRTVLAEKPVAALADLPEMTDPRALATSRLLHRLALAAYFGAPGLLGLINLTHLGLLLKNGNDHLASSTYAGFGFLLIGQFREIGLACEFGNLALRLAQRPNARGTQARTIFVVNWTLSMWEKPLRNMLDAFLEGYQRGLETGEFEFAALSLVALLEYKVALGVPLGEFQEEMRVHQSAMTAMRQERQVVSCGCFRQFVANLTGLAETPHRLVGQWADITTLEDELRTRGDLRTLASVGVLRLYLGTLFDRPEEALAGAELARANYHTFQSSCFSPRFLALESIRWLAVPPTDPETAEAIRNRLAENRTRLELWAAHAPMNFAQLLHLVEAEQFRRDNRVGEAIDAYDRSIAVARENGFIHDEALANELAARFFMELEKPKLALPYAREARHGYVRWGAVAKVADLDQRFAGLTGNSDGRGTGSLSTVRSNSATGDDSSSKALDYAAVMRAAQSLSGEIVTENLLATVLRVAVEIAGAQRGALVLPDQRGAWRVEAERDVLTGVTRTLHAESLADTAALPRTIANFVIRSGEAVLLDDAAESRQFAADPYLPAVRPRAIWCLPVQRQGRTTALLYLEHRAMPNVFTPARREALDIIAAQAAVSLENARLYADLEAKVRERTEALSQANSELAETVTKLEAAQAETVRKNEELDRKIYELNHKNRELLVAHQQADRIFSALALALPGTVLDARYRLDEKIGEGGFGIVFRATHLTLGRPIAVKVFKPRPGNDNAEAIERFKREGISISRLSHPNIISVLDSGISAQGIAYLVMELLKGISLADELRGNGLTTLRHCLDRIVPVCRALAEAHRMGIIHRDVKPDNIFLNQSPEGETVKVVDFGIAKMMTDDPGEELERLTATDCLIGTPIYMPPERFSAKPYDGRADVYGVGVVLYEMLAGRPPFEKSLSGLVGLMLAHLNDPPPPLRELNPLVPPAIEEIIARTLEKAPERRPSASELADLLAESSKTIPTEVAETPFDRRAPREAFISTIYSDSRLP